MFIVRTGAEACPLPTSAMLILAQNNIRPTELLKSARRMVYTHFVPRGTQNA